MLRMYWTRCELTGKLQARWVRAAAPALPASQLRRHSAALARTNASGAAAAISRTKPTLKQGFNENAYSS